MSHCTVCICSFFVCDYKVSTPEQLGDSFRVNTCPLAVSAPTDPCTDSSYVNNVPLANAFCSMITDPFGKFACSGFGEALVQSQEVFGSILIRVDTSPYKIFSQSAPRASFLICDTGLPFRLHLLACVWCCRCYIVCVQWSRRKGFGTFVGRSFNLAQI